MTVAELSIVPPCIVRAFEGRASLSFTETAALLEMDEKTLRGHVNLGNISFINKGLSTSRPRREFTLRDVAGFYEKISGACQSTNVRVRRSTTSTSGTKVYDFMDRRSRPSAVAPKR